MIKAIIFDIGGVLVRTEDKGPRRVLAGGYGMTAEALEDLVFNGEAGHAAQRGEVSAEDHWEYVGRKLNIPAEKISVFQDRFFAGDVLDTELVQYIRSLRPRFTTAIITNALGDVRHNLEHQFKIAGDFDHIVVSAEEGIMKPEPRIYHTALNRCGVRPEEAVFIDDFLHNVEGARNLGMKAVHFRDRKSTVQAIQRLIG